MAVLSDVHGNAPARAAVLAAIDAEGVGLVLNLGDIVSGAVDPRATPDLLATRPDIVTAQEPSGLYGSFYPSETRVSPHRTD
ncbi:metallophosphoesterase family protein [Promicromonospora panici]|uniref:metallophosphoesterase family protein n=1 Tax=Promicromonospora panici TaxID=2219658 RepID=UPI00101C3769|nr:metallophosphoesterase family protein [Promicromonospora panici]